MKRKLVYVISDIDKSLGFEWAAEKLNIYYDLFYILIGNEQTALSHYLKNRKIKFEVVSDKSSRSFLRKFFKVFFILRRERPYIVHIHLWRSLFLALPTAWLLRTKKRIFTRHHATIHYREHPSGLKWDKLFNWLATDIIAISNNVRDILIDYDFAKPDKIHVIHHGFDLNYFNEAVNKSTLLREKYKIPPEKWPIIGVISRYLELKGIQYIIPAFKEILMKYPQAHLILANSVGEFQAEIKSMLKDLSNNSYTEIVFENDLYSLYKLFDVFIHVPIDKCCEAFGQTYIEALALGVPSIFTLSGVAPEFIVHEDNALVVDYCDNKAISLSAERLLKDPILMDSLVKRGKESVQKFSINEMITKLKSLYDE